MSTFITEAQQRAAYDALGLDPELYKRTASVLIEPWKVTVTHYAGERTHIDPETGKPAVEVTVLELAGAVRTS